MRRKLGRSNIEVSAMGMGCWAIGGPYTNEKNLPCGWGDVDDQESIRTIHRAIDLGVTFFDTAACYGCGHSEEILGGSLQSKRKQVVIATKFWHTFDTHNRITAGTLEDPSRIASSVKDSCQRLRTDYIDLLQFHQGNYPADQAGKIRDACQMLVDEGVIRAYGWSTDDPGRAAVFAKGKDCAAIQMRLNVLQRNDESIALCEQENLASINKGPLIKGLLTGKFDRQSQFADNDVRKPWWDLQDGAEGDMLDQLDKIRQVLTSDGRTLAQGALGWIWARSDVTIPIPGCRTVKQIEENAAAMDFGPLSDAQMRQIDEILGLDRTEN
ncbi:MAG: aldo/keto reductase [Phycisphaerae bacterium]